MHTTWKCIVPLTGAVLFGGASGCESEEPSKYDDEDASHYWETLLADHGKEPASVPKSMKSVSRKRDAAFDETWAGGGSVNATEPLDTAGAAFGGSTSWDTGGASSNPPNPEPSRWCDWRDCSEVPLALWRFDDCNAQSSALADSAPNYYYNYYYYSGPHPAFRAVSARCVEGMRSQGIRLAVPDDVIYSLDQPDYDFAQGFTIAMWVKADEVTGTHTLARKRLDESSAIALVIDKGRIHFVVRTSDGRPHGVSAAIQAGVETHVAATHDGDMIRLFLDGSVVASRKAEGRIAVGAGPIFMGNDAKNRLFKGMFEEVWLSNLATTERIIKELGCLRRPPEITVSPTTTPPMQPRVPVTFVATLKNMNRQGSCSVDIFTLCESTGWMLTSDHAELCEGVELGPGDTYTRISNISGGDSEMLGTYSVTWNADTWSDFGGSYSAWTTAEFTLAPSPCLPAVVTLSPAVSAPTTFWTEVPFTLTIMNPNDPLLCPNSLFNFWFDNWWNMGTSEPSGSIVIAPGETAIREPRVTVYENYYSSQPFEVRYTVCHEWGFKCATASSQIRILGSFAYNFDSTYDGFEFDWWTNPDPDYPFTNIVAQVPEGQSPPWMDLDYESGSPTAPSLRLTLPFTTTHQYAYVIRRLPYVDLSHKILRARVRWVSGSFATGAIQYGAWSGEDWAYGSMSLNSVPVVRGGGG
ncbi:MAG: LamG domain-containing protein, partial [Myxococcales bacterium]